MLPIRPVLDNLDEIGALLHFVRQFQNALANDYQSQLTLTSTATAVLKEIGADKSGSWTQSQLAECLCVSESTLCTLIERLRKDGLIHRQRLQIDRRKTQLDLTDAGYVVVEKIHEIDRSMLRRIHLELSSSELSSLQILLARITSSLVHHDQAADAARRAA